MTGVSNENRVDVHIMSVCLMPMLGYWIKTCRRRPSAVFSAHL